jgi:hypothetical protein
MINMYTAFTSAVLIAYDDRTPIIITLRSPETNAIGDGTWSKVTQKRKLRPSWDGDLNDVRIKERGRK